MKSDMTLRLSNALIAHFNPSSPNDPHQLSDHLHAVGRRAAEFTNPFDKGRLSSIVALCHDIGKAHPDFQSYVKTQIAHRGSVKHALPGAYLFSLHRSSLTHSHLTISYLIENMIAGHHRGLYDMNHSFLKLYDEFSDEGFSAEVKQFVLEQAEVFRNLPALPQWHDPIYCAALTRFVFSAVIDADWLDTEAYFNKERSSKRVYDAFPFHTFQGKFHAFVRKFPENKLTAFREAAELKGTEVGSYFELTLPTGYGKTLASLAFALEHAKRFNKSRIITALPLITLTSEISALYRDLFGKEHVIEDHSAFHPKTISNEEETTSGARLAIENWDRNFIVTTTVQLFDSIFSNKPWKLRKVHRLVGSVLILDEFHLLPSQLLPSILKMLDVLQEHFDMTVLLVSATPLPLTTSKAIQELKLHHLPKVIAPPVETPRRVNYSLLGQLTEQSLLEKVTNDSTLIIVNTRKRAQQLYKLAVKQFPDRPVYHLSTSLTANAREEKVKKIRGKIKNRPLVISTSLLESGIDLSFQCLFREMAPLPAIIQAAGRCNRYSEQVLGQVYLFTWPKPNYPSPSYESGVRQLERLLKENGTSVFYSSSTMASYYRRVLDLDFKKSPITEKDTLQFETMAEKFKMIDSHGITVLCPQSSGFQQGWLDENKTRLWWRKVQPYTAQAPFSMHHHIEYIKGIPVWTGPYDDELGILLI
ncbi:CRISPR-associated helicase Cas3' [Sporosarcina highlanderae]|uniref:CRISPR-associated helicase Cas3 n=1 Tax=Sporosarcina highlanderae TaxID=3035916 RepID=A0ABT8JNT5_9BACL|nr:CRISPR-associated helicase Cas3' [Sporosarcina highlanderae]MDN4606805.1 CRISPR-associated helicase Cas3' [Sporosarcina highlanderae]